MSCKLWRDFQEGNQKFYSYVCKKYHAVSEKYFVIGWWHFCNKSGTENLDNFSIERP